MEKQIKKISYNEIPRKSSKANTDVSLIRIIHEKNRKESNMSKKTDRVENREKTEEKSKKEKKSKVKSDLIIFGIR